jgi:hypothetical protein
VPSFHSRRVGLPSFLCRRVGVLSNRASSPVGTRKRRSSIKKECESVQIAHPCMDSIFRHGFSDPSILKEFLNAVLEFEGAAAIDQIIDLPGAFPSNATQANSGYCFTVDVRCRTKSGRHLVIEMQNDFRNDYHVKALVEHSRMLSLLDKNQIAADRTNRAAKNVNDKNKFWKGVEGLYTIIVTNKRLSSKKLKSYYSGEAVMEPFVVNPYELRHAKQLDRHYGDIPIQIVFLMLGNLSPPLLGQVLTPVQRWAHALKDPLRGGVTKIPKTKTIEDVDAVAGDVKAIRAFIERLDITKLPADVKESYEHSIDYLDYHRGALIDIQNKATAKGREEGIKEGRENAIKEAREKGIKEGREEGIKEGREKGIKEGRENAIKEGREKGFKVGEENVLKGIAKRLKAQGKSNQEIAEMTCRSLEFVEHLLSPQYEGSAGR